MNDLDQELEALGVTPGWRPPGDQPQSAPASTTAAAGNEPQVYTLTWDNTVVLAALGFPARSVTIDNRSSMDVFIDELNRWAPAGMVGVTMQVPALTRLHARFQTPPSYPQQAAPLAGQLATLTLYDYEQDEHPGVAVPTLPGQPQPTVDLTDKAARKLGHVNVDEVGVVLVTQARISAAINTPTVLMPPNISRKQLTFWNNGAAADLYTDLVVTAGSGLGLFTQLPATPAAYELPRNPTIYQGQVQGQAFVAPGLDVFMTEWA